MFEQKINTVSIRVNEESFAVVPFDNYKDAVQAAKQALVALNTGERVELLGKRLDAVERALGDKSTCGIATPLVDGISEWWKNAFAEDEGFRRQHHDAIKALNERVEDPESKEVMGRLIPINCDFVGTLFDVLARGHLVPDNPFENGGIFDTRNRMNKPKPEEKARHHESPPDDWLTWGYQDGDLPMTLTTNAETARDWVLEGKRVFEIQKKPINY